MSTTSRADAEETKGEREEDATSAPGISRTPEQAAPAGASHGCRNVLYCEGFIRGPQYTTRPGQSQLTKTAHPAGLQGVKHRRPSRNPRAGPFLFLLPRRPAPRRRPSSDSSGGVACSGTGTFSGAALSRARLSKSPAPSHVRPEGLPRGRRAHRTPEAVEQRPAPLRGAHGGGAYAPGQGTPPPRKTGSPL